MSTGNKSANQQRLIGWLVSYADSDLGKSYELRAGRTLISRHAENGNPTIQVEADGVSAPHSAFSAAQSHRVLVQDIFSDAGTYLRKAGSRREQRLDGPVEIAHGDWVRFGDDSRYQVCLIDNPDA